MAVAQLSRIDALRAGDASIWERGVRRLRGDHRRCFDLRFLENNTVAQTAAALQCSESAVRLLECRMLNELSTFLTSTGRGVGGPLRPAVDGVTTGRHGAGIAVARAAWRSDPDVVGSRLALLPASQRRWVELAVVGGLSAAEVATAMHRTENAARVLQHRALRRLFALLTLPMPETRHTLVDTARSAWRTDSAAFGACLEQLTPGQRRCVQLRIVEGLSIAATAAAMGRTHNATRVLCHGALRRLDQLLSGRRSRPYRGVRPGADAARCR